MIYFIWLMVAVLTLSGCGSAANSADTEPAAEPPQVEEEGGALSTVAPTETAASPTETAVPATDTSEPAGESESAAPVAPETVDLGEVTSEPPDNEEPVVMPAPGVPDPSVKMSNMAAQELAKTLQIDVSEIETISAEAVTWSDSSLGCPQPGMNYLTVLTPGYRIILAAQGEEYEYHTDQNQYVVQCEGGEPVQDQ